MHSEFEASLGNIRPLSQGRRVGEEEEEGQKKIYLFENWNSHLTDLFEEEFLANESLVFTGILLSEWVAHAQNPRTQDAEKGGSPRVPGQLCQTYMYIFHRCIRIVSFLCSLQSSPQAKLQFSPTKPHVSCLTRVRYYQVVISKVKTFFLTTYLKGDGGGRIVSL